MIQAFALRQSQVVQNISSGEYTSTSESNAIFSTIVGSCVSVCLADKINGVYGINHFMLPGENWQKITDPKFGTPATNLLIQQMIGKGANKNFLEAKVFGASQTFGLYGLNIGKSNADFIRKYLGALNIPVIDSDLGGNFGRKILFYCNQWKVYVQKIHIDPQDINGRG